MKDWWAKPRNISVVVDTPGWFDDYARQLVERLNASGEKAIFARSASEILTGGVAFYLSCLKITPKHILEANHQNIVVHASALPHGRGFSPIVWQVLEGQNRIPISMILATEEVDQGPILMTDQLVLGGYELNSEIRDMLGTKIVEMCQSYLLSAAPVEGLPQQGEPSWYSRRRPEDSRLSPDKSIAEQFDLLRVVDNERYPAFFEHRGHRYVLKIERDDVSDEKARGKGPQ